MRIVATYKTKHDGIVQITEDDADGGTESGKHYDAYWSYNFIFSFRLGQGSASSGELERTMDYVREWDPEIELIEDFGEWELYARDEEDGSIAVGLKKDWGCERPIKAKDVPVGSFLVFDAVYFFRFWKGSEAVGDRRQLVL